MLKNIKLRDVVTSVIDYLFELYIFIAVYIMNDCR